MILSDADKLINDYLEYLINVRQTSISNSTKENYRDTAKNEMEFRWQDIYHEPFSTFKFDENGVFKLHRLMRTGYPKRYFTGIVSFIDFLKATIHPDFLNENYKKIRYPLNQILYGPPGTGKTYNTIDLAIQIVDADYILENKTRMEVADYFRSLLFNEELNPNGQIVFTTFHQSMAYEDFIEGIKPVIIVDQEDQSVESEPSISELDYVIKDGIFKEIVNLAKKSTKSTLEFEELWQNYLIELRKESSTKTFTSVSSELKLDSIESNGNSINVRFKKSWNPDEPEGTRAFIVSRNMIERLFDAKVDGSESNRKGRIDVAKIIGSGRATHIYSVYKDFYRFAETNEAFSKGQTLNYVIIIDEINRGNVSAIFGELITLIEKDKRIGEENELSVVLPYSREKFSIPMNLYIIGTMNTADRSVEALDTALRRRFSFTEMLPLPEKLENKDINGINLTEMLRLINQRIELLIDRDHTIGHAFFMNVDSLNSLQNTFAKNVIPLLQEYFYGDYSKMEMVIGPLFFNQEDRKVEWKLFAVTNNNYDLPENQLKLLDVAKMENEMFLHAIKRMMNVNYKVPSKNTSNQVEPVIQSVETEDIQS